MKKLVLTGLLFGSLAMAATSYDVLPYGGYINYDGSTTKDYGYVGGVYFSAMQSPWKTELDAEHTLIKYNDSTPDLRQSDFTAIVHYYQGYNLAYKVGMHYINSTDELTDGGKVFMGGVLYYETGLYNAGVDVYYSNYSNENISPTIYQISPKVGYNLGNYGNLGAFYVEGKIDYIVPSKNKSENDLRSSYTSLEVTLNNYYGPYTTTLSTWIGKRAYAVENGGFIVNNIGDEQTGGFKISENYKLDRVSSAKVEYSYTKFKDNGDSHSQTILASYNYSF